MDLLKPGQQCEVNSISHSNWLSVTELHSASSRSLATSSEMQKTRQREVIAEAVALLGADLALVHTKDVSSTGEAVAAGRGVVDFHNFLKGIVSTGYRGPLVSHNLPEKDAAYVSGFLRRVLDEVMA